MLRAMGTALSEEIARLTDLATDLMKRALSRGVDVAEVRARSGSELSVKVRLGEPELIEEAGHKSVGMRVMKAGKVALTSTSDLTPTGLARFVDDALELVEVSQEDPFAGPADPSLLAKGALPELDLFDPSTDAVDAERAIELAKRGEAAARAADPRITKSDGASFARTTGCFSMVLSTGFAGGYAGSFSSISVVPVADDEGDKKRRGFYYSAKRHLADLMTPEAVGEEAARRTLRKLGAKKVPTCEAPVVFDPDAARALLGLLGGAIMGSSIWRKSSYLVGREGTVVASPLITVIDDPLIVRGPGSRPFDGEGLASRKNLVVEDGKLVQYLCDAYSGRKLSRPPTASAARGAGAGVGPSTSNFVLSPTKTPAADIVKSTQRGLYVTEMMGFGYNPVTGDFSRGAAGFWIENGELAFPVSEVTISLNLDDLWKRVDAVGDDLDLRSSTASPTIRVSSMTIAGS
jgi:PmbA protein